MRSNYLTVKELSTDGFDEEIFNAAVRKELESFRKKLRPFSKYKIAKISKIEQDKKSGIQYFTLTTNYNNLSSPWSRNTKKCTRTVIAPSKALVNLHADSLIEINNVNANVNIKVIDLLSFIKGYIIFNSRLTDEYYNFKNLVGHDTGPKLSKVISGGFYSYSSYVLIKNLEKLTKTGMKYNRKYLFLPWAHIKKQIATDCLINNFIFVSTGSHGQYTFLNPPGCHGSLGRDINESINKQDFDKLISLSQIQYWSKDDVWNPGSKFDRAQINI